MKTTFSTAAALLSFFLINGCAGSLPPVPTVAQVDLQRFMGDWYVIAHIPTAFERNAFNAVERYTLNDDGVIETDFSFRKGGFDGKEKRFYPSAVVRDEQSNAIWGMRFLWPFRADYRIAWLDPDYSITVIARKKRDYVWLMAREPQLSDSDYQRLSQFIESIGYDISQLRKVPQSWNSEQLL